MFDVDLFNPDEKKELQSLERSNPVPSTHHENEARLARGEMGGNQLLDEMRFIQ